MSRVLLQLFDITREFGMHLRPELILLQKTMVQVEGVARNIDPSHDIWTAADPVVKRWTRREFGPEGVARVAQATLKQTAIRLRRLPAMLENLDIALARASEPRPDQTRQRALPGWAWFSVGSAAGAGLTAAVVALLLLLDAWPF